LLLRDARLLIRGCTLPFGNFGLLVRRGECGFSDRIFLLSGTDASPRKPGQKRGEVRKQKGCPRHNEATEIAC
jgi:hypothetical protein